VSEIQRIIDATVIPADAEDRQRAVVAEIVSQVRSAISVPQHADRSFLTKVADRLRDLPPHIDSDGQLEALQAVCRFFLGKDQDLAFAMEAAAGVTRLARTTGRKPELLNGLLMQAVVASQLDNHIEALESCASAREVAIEIGSPLGELKAVTNAAAFLLNVGDYQYALDLLRHGLTIVDRCPEAEDILWVVLGNIAQCYLFLGEYEEALQTVGAARAMAKEPTDAHAAGNRAILEYTQLRTLVALKRGTEARPVLDAMGRYAEKAGTVRARIDYACARGMLEVVEGQRDLGLSRIVAAREKAKLVTSTLPDVLSVMVAAQNAVGNAEAATKAREELNQLLATRQETSRLRAALMFVPAIGVAGRSERTGEYDRRLDAARERLLRHQT